MEKQLRNLHITKRKQNFKTKKKTFGLGFLNNKNKRKPRSKLRKKEEKMEPLNEAGAVDGNKSTKL